VTSKWKGTCFMGDMCQLRNMQFKMESNLVGGVHFPLSDPFPNSLGSIVDLCIFHTPLKPVSHEDDLCFPVKPIIYVIARVRVVPYRILVVAIP
jgi:hypothetical protein